MARNTTPRRDTIPNLPRRFSWVAPHGNERTHTHKYFHHKFLFFSFSFFFKYFSQLLYIILTFWLFYLLAMPQQKYFLSFFLYFFLCLYLIPFVTKFRSKAWSSIWRERERNCASLTSEFISSFNWVYTLLALFCCIYRRRIIPYPRFISLSSFMRVSLWDNPF